MPGVEDQGTVAIAEGARGVHILWLRYALDSDFLSGLASLRNQETQSFQGAKPGQPGRFVFLFQGVRLGGTQMVLVRQK